MLNTLEVIEGSIAFALYCSSVSIEVPDFPPVNLCDSEILPV